MWRRRRDTSAEQRSQGITRHARLVALGLNDAGIDQSPGLEATDASLTARRDPPPRRSLMPPMLLRQRLGDRTSQTVADASATAFSPGGHSRRAAREGRITSDVAACCSVPRSLGRTRISLFCRRFDRFSSNPTKRHRAECQYAEQR